MAAGGFNARLESMRGVAALAVVYNHSVSFINAAGGLSSMPFSEHTTFMQSLLVLASVLSAGGAVILFFVLSGYVLSLAFLRKEQPISTQVGPYLVRRVFRLFPAMWLSILAFAATLWIVPDRVIGLTINPSYVVRALTLQSYNANPVIWTMYVEAICSVLLPALVAATRRSRVFGVLIFAAAGVVSFMPLHFDNPMRFVVCFQAGVLLACNQSWTDWIIKPLPVFLTGMLVIFIQNISNVGGGAWFVPLQTTGSIMLLAAVLASSRSKHFGWLDLKPVEFFGRISYSVYLFQLVPLVLLTQALALGLLGPGYFLPKLIMIVGTIAAIIPIAWLTYRWVEAPSIRLGRRLSDHISRAARRPEIGSGNLSLGAGVSEA